MTPELVATIGTIVVALITTGGGITIASINAKADRLRDELVEERAAREALAVALEDERGKRRALEAKLRELESELDEWIDAYEALWQAARRKGVSEPARPRRRRPPQDEGAE